MPVYEYRCGKCEELTEALRRMGDADEPVPCEACGSRATERVHSVFSAGPAVGGPSGDAMPACQMGAGPCCGGGACGMG
jgi:putative FmdB family regulatory protein